MFLPHVNMWLKHRGDHDPHTKYMLKALTLELQCTKIHTV